MASLVERFQGCLLGLAVGDALGTTLEFTPPGRGGAPPLTTVVGGGPFGLRAGQWTDDTSMALCLAESLVARDGFDARDQMERYVRWWLATLHEGDRIGRLATALHERGTARRTPAEPPAAPPSAPG